MAEQEDTRLFRSDLPLREDPLRRMIDRRMPWAHHGELFSQQSLGVGPWQEQGWKLHVSATPLSAVAVLEAALAVLFAEGVRFKVVGSIGRLEAMNAAMFGLSQVGKFITVYPSDDAQAVRLAVALDEATRGYRGPRIPTDRPLRPDSLVHYRYGALIQRPEAQAAGGESGGIYDLLDGAGRLTTDQRMHYYLPPPPEVVDPFEAAGVYVPRPERRLLLKGRFLINDALAQGSRGGVFRAVDLGTKPVRLCLVKEAWHDVCLDQYGRDARDWAANEERVLTTYAGDPALPEFYDRFEQDDNHYIVLEYVEGVPLNRVLSDNPSLKDGIDPAEVAAIGRTTAEALAHLHEIGLVFRDFKTQNVIKTAEGGYRLIDFGIAYQYRIDDDPVLGLGTPPYYPREQYHSEHPTPVDDIFGWGAVLHHLACGEASVADMPTGLDWMRPFPRRPVAELRPDFPAALAAVIDRAVAWERAERFASMAEARAALVAAAAEDDGAARPAPARISIVGGVDAPVSASSAGLGTTEAILFAREAGDALCAAAEERNDGLRWAAREEWSDRHEYSPDLYRGAAGVGLYLAALARATGEVRYAEAARGAARWLGGPVWGRGRAQHGFHNGEPGVAYFFLRLAELLDEPGYVQAAELRMRRLRGAPFATVDLLYGAAGTILTLVRLHAVTGERGYLLDARDLGDQLVQSAESAPNGGYYWDVAPPWPGEAHQPYLGLMHGVAGIGLALAELAAATGEEGYFGVATGAADVLLAEARVSDEGAMSWSRHLWDTSPGPQAHCHGAGGIGQFFLRMNRLAPDGRYRDAAEGAAQTLAAQMETEARSGLCHGLSGTGNVMLNVYQAHGGEQWLERARACGSRLQQFRVPAPDVSPSQERGDGDAERGAVYAMHGEGASSPDLMLGYAGVGSFLLRLADPKTAPDQILG